MKLLTIVIPTYNMELYLDKCLKSLVLDDETLMNKLEVLVVIDGSKDRSSDIAHKYQSSYPDTFLVIDKENGNYGSCINRGLQEAKGKYIKVLDSDDYFDTPNFESFLHFLCNTEADCVITPMVQVYEDGSEKKKWEYNLPDCTFSLDGLGKAAEYMWMHCVCYKTDNVKRINYHQTEGISYTDQEWICLPMSTMNTIVYFPHVVYKYLIGREGQTVNTSVHQKNFWMEMKGLTKMLHDQNNLYKDCGIEGRRYIDIRVRYRTKLLYYTFFNSFNFSSYHNNKYIADFDKELLKYNKSLYEELNTIHAGIFYYVKHWRKKYTIEDNYFRLLKTLQRINQMIRLK